MTLDLFPLLVRCLHFAAAMLAFGAAIFPFYAGVTARFPMRVVAAVSLTSGLVWFAQILLDVTGDPATAFTPDTIRLVLFNTSFGMTWLIHLTLAAGFMGLALLESPIRVAAMSALNLVSLMSIGHAAAGEGAVHAFNLIVHGAHLLAGGLWLGGLIPLWQALRTCEEARRPALVARFSAVGYAAVAVIGVTGLLNTRAITGGFLPDASSSYGQMLLLKIGLFLVLMLLAAFNQFRSTRRAQWTSLRRGIVAELVVFAALLLVVSALGVTPPMS